MIRIKVLHPGQNATYHYWGGFGPVRENPTNWGTVTSSFINLVTMDEETFDFFETTVNAWWTADLTDIAAAVNA